jgi:LuxR family maltose regulon positive regulatory protein
VAWLSLDKRDNGPIRFLSYLIVSPQTIEDDIGRGLLAALRSPGTINAEAVLTNLVNEITSLSDILILVLDDFHVIESQADTTYVRRR